ncbi:restriction endonuclease subunit S [Clostridium perfringens]
MSFKETEVGRIPIDWEVDELSNKVDLVMGQSPKSEFYNDKGIGMPFMQGRTTFGEKYHYINTWCTDIKRVGIKNSVLMSVRAPVGDVNIATEDICIGRGLASLNMKNKNNEFLYYLLKNYSGLLISKESGTVFGSINKAGIEKLVLPFPSNSEQKAIAKILSDLDEKIEVNNKINKNLEEMAQAIFKQWFVDFEFPNEEGKPYKSSGGEMVESELGMIPKDWEIKNIEDFCEVCSSKRIFMKDYVKSGIPFYRSKEIIELSNGNNITTELYISNKKFNEINSKFGVPKKGDILLTSVGTLGISYLVNSDNFYFKDGNLTWFKSFIGNSNIYIYSFLSSFEGKKAFDKITIGSTQKALTISALKKIKLVKPTDKIIDKYTLVCQSLVDKIEFVVSENRNLEKLRDTLLPKLMSGEIRVPLENNEN